MSGLDFLAGKATAVLSIITLLGATATGLLWLDTRYMHSEVAAMLREQDKNANDIVHTEIHLMVVTRAMKYYEKVFDNEGYIPTAQEEREYGVLKDTVDRLESKQNKAMGLP